MPADADFATDAASTSAVRITLQYSPSGFARLGSDLWRPGARLLATGDFTGIAEKHSEALPADGAILAAAAGDRPPGRPPVNRAFSLRRI